MKGVKDAEVSIGWRVGLPKTEAEILAEVKEKQAMGLISDKAALRALNPTFSEDQIEALLEELAGERQARLTEEMDAMPSVAVTG